MSDDLKAIPRRLIEEVYNQGKLDVVYEVIAAEYVGHDPSLPEDIAGAAAERELAELRTAWRFPTFRSRSRTRSPRETEW